MFKVLESAVEDEDAQEFAKKIKGIL